MLAALEDPGCLASPPEGSRQVWGEPTGSELGAEQKGRSTGGAGDTSRNPNAGWLWVEGDSPKPQKHLCPGRTHGQQVALGLLTSQVPWSPGLLTLPNLGPQTQRTEQGSAGPQLSCRLCDQRARRGSADAGKAGTRSLWLRNAPSP